VTDWVESAEAISGVDDLLASVGLGHGRRKTLAGTWAAGERRTGRVAGRSQGGGVLEVVRAPGWERYAWLRHGFSTRAGGVSSVYGDGDLNLGWTKQDDQSHVAENRARFVRAVGGGTLIGVRQFHSAMISVVEAGVEGLAAADGKPILRGDGLMTDVPGVLLGVMVADCVPVVVADVRRRAIAVFHAGWRGTLARIVERGIGTMRLRYGSRPADMIAAIGPAIGACCYSVGEEVRFDFESQFAYAGALFSEVYDSDPVREKYPLLFLTARAPGHSNIGPQIHLDLAAANRRQLLDAGLKPGRVTVVGECTACSGEPGRRRYFSHRGESGFAGRMMGVVGVAGANELAERG
jgi:YfiH family protein